MKIVYQRVSRASVKVGERLVSKIGKGALLLLAVEKGDSEADLLWGARKCAELRTFEDDKRKMNLSLLDVSGKALVVSQFTLAGNVDKGRRPSFDKAERPEIALAMYDKFCQLLSAQGVAVERGEFGAMMEVELINDGPVTLIIERGGNA
jgi:D-tyrosyl-tRNA(Tyr) deacylase